MQILIIEDEPRAVRQLRNMLNACNFDYQVLDVIDSVEDAITWFKTNATPQLVFMDIQLADGLSFEIFQKTQITAPIIFTTAFDQYAIQAFKVNSIDYLLKPIRKEDLKHALDKFQKTNQPSSLAPGILKKLLGSLQTQEYRSGILVKDGNGFVQVQMADIVYFYSEDSITFAVTQDKRFIVDETLDQLSTTLDPKIFYQINRGQVIAKKAILKVNPYFNHRLKLTVSSPRNQEFIVSRPKTKAFKNWLNF
ncbi:LytTR family DNA-binding domain-containing protein [Croceitalea sp. MTPC5]|uniref:LytR/AlgR family response regulator transcription factor n=1 Tax=Croceitalea sp. MTPC5 TaxID=3056565 RepID=UPI002B3C03DD|nr:LytTR family DNA-binding domain-containing protein [Croceitalea sp. MTPC5]